MRPLWLAFENASDQFSVGDHASRKYIEPILIMYKQGDGKKDWNYLNR